MHDSYGSNRRRWPSSSQTMQHSSDTLVGMRLSDMVPLLFDVPVSWCVATPQMYEETLLGEEATTLSSAIAARRREYAAGRAAARQALSNIGVSPGPIVTQQDRTPKWPPGIVGSISHCAGCCIAVVADSTEAIGIGIDVENATPLPIELFHMICGDKDEGGFATLGPLGGKLAFCAKEAFYKCYYPITKELLDFSDVSVRFASNRERDAGHFDAAITNPNRPRLPGGWRVTGRWLVAHGYILVGVSCASEVPTQRD
jgi:4'-phosphopantetheinyl transferase EntD